MTAVENSEYVFARLYVGPTVETHTVYTISVWGDIQDDNVRVYFGGGMNGSIGKLDHIGENLWSCIGEWPRDWTIPLDFNGIILFSNKNSGNAHAVTNRIDRAKIELGANPNPIWTPNLDNYKSIYTRLAALENKQ